MANTLPISSSTDKNVKSVSQSHFGGLRTSETADGGDTVECKNFSSRSYPRMSVRKKRKYLSAAATYGVPRAVALTDKIYVIESARLYLCEGSTRELCCTLSTDSNKYVVGCGNDLFILPDHIYYDGISGDSMSMQTSTGRILVRLSGKKLTTDDVDLWELGFRQGDGITVYTSPSDVTSYTFRENYKVVSANEHTITVNTDFPYEGDCYVFVTRDTPTLSCALSLGDRMIGASSTVIFISEKGNVRNWRYMSGEESDPASLTSFSEGSFTACSEWNGYPIFFKPGVICKVLGNRASGYALCEIKAAGIPSWAQKTLVNIGGSLYYCSTSGVYKYDGGYPVRIDGGALPDGLVGIAAASDGERYYLSTSEGIYVYDTKSKVWYFEDGEKAVSMSGRAGEVYILTASGALWGVGDRVEGVSEGRLESIATFGYDDCGTTDMKSLISIGVTYCAENDADLEVYVSLDGGEEQLIGSCTCDGKWHTEVLACPSNRCRGFTVRLHAQGDVTVSDVTRRYRTVG